jgi:hypothetical protein
MAVAGFYLDLGKAGTKRMCKNGAKTGEKVRDGVGESAIQVFFT